MRTVEHFFTVIFASSPQEHYQIWKWPGITHPDPGSQEKIDEEKVTFFRRRVYQNVWYVLIVNEHIWAPILSCILLYSIFIYLGFTAYFGATSVPVTIPSSGIQRNSIGSFSQSPTSPLGGSLSSAFMSNPQQQNKEDKHMEQVRNVSMSVLSILNQFDLIWTKNEMLELTRKLSNNESHSLSEEVKQN